MKNKDFKDLLTSIKQARKIHRERMRGTKMKKNKYNIGDKVKILTAVLGKSIGRINVIDYDEDLKMNLYCVTGQTWYFREDELRKY